METVCQVALNLMNHAEARKAESVLREYLLRAADQVSLNVIGSSSVSMFRILSHSHQHRRFESMLNEDDVVSRSEHNWIFNLTENIKSFFAHTGILVTGKDQFFYGFTDPKFLKHGAEIATIIVNERLINLYIPDSDKADLANQGVYLDSPSI